MRARLRPGADPPALPSSRTAHALGSLPESRWQRLSVLMSSIHTGTAGAKVPAKASATETHCQTRHDRCHSRSCGADTSPHCSSQVARGY